MQILEQVARAICTSADIWIPDDKVYDVDGRKIFAWELYIKEAKAAIQSLIDARRAEFGLGKTIAGLPCDYDPFIEMWLQSILNEE